MEFIEYPDRDMLVMNLTDRLASSLSAALRREESATFCVPGGNTPRPVFDSLCEQPLDWSRVNVLLNDERWVPESSERSNTALLKRRLLRDKAAAAGYLPLYADAPRPEDRIDALTAGILPHLPISVLLLGMGTDMHTASLFPGADRLEEALAENAPPLMAMRADAAGEPRITLTAPVLRAAIDTHILIVGREKREALERAQKLSPSEAPVRAVLPGATVHWAE